MKSRHMMRVGFLMLLAGLLATSAQAAIEFDAASSIPVGQTGTADTNAISSATWQHTVGSGSDRLLVVGLSIEQYGDTPPAITPNVTSVTYGGAALTRIDDAFSTTHSELSDYVQTTELWYLLSPASGTANVAVTLEAATENLIAGAISLTGVAQQGPEAAVGNSTIFWAWGADLPWVSFITPVTNGAWIIDQVGSSLDSEFVPRPGHTMRWGTTADGSGGAASTRYVPEARSTTMHWSSNNGVWSTQLTHSLAAFAPTVPAVVEEEEEIEVGGGVSLTDFEGPCAGADCGDWHDGDNNFTTTTVENGYCILPSVGWSQEGFFFNQATADTPLSGDFSVEWSINVQKTYEFTGSANLNWPNHNYLGMGIGGDTYMAWVLWDIPAAGSTGGLCASLDPVNGTVYSADAFTKDTVTWVTIRLLRIGSEVTIQYRFDDLPWVTMSKATNANSNGTVTSILLAGLGNGNLQSVYDNLVVRGANIQTYPAMPDTNEGESITCNVTADDVELGAYVSLSAPASTSYRWYKDGQPIVGQTGQTLVFDSIDESDLGTYVCAYDNGSGAIVATLPLTLSVGGAGSLPAATVAGILLLTALAGVAGLRSLKKN